MEINDKIQTLKKSRWWDKGDVGRIVHKTYDSYDRVVYLFVLIQHVIKCMTTMVDMCGMSDLSNVSYIDQTG